MSSAAERPRRILLATRSVGKLRELHPMVRAAGWEAGDLDSEGIPESPIESTLESADTFEENALAKARYFHTRSGMPTVADDSGLEVVALGGAPGVLSKRWSGRADLDSQSLDDANNAVLLDRLRNVDDRRARYVCAAAYCDKESEIVVRGEVDGTITIEPRGTGGFGYDPYFKSIELGRTFGEVTRDEKARVSHRARAIAKLLQRMAPRR